MGEADRIQLCDREFFFHYFLRSPVRYACERVFDAFGSTKLVPTHRTLHVDVLDRPSGGVWFPQGRVLVDGSVWTLVEKGDYLFLRIASPLEKAGTMEAIFSLNRNRLKVFVDTPWICQHSFGAAWNLLFQVVFRASLDPRAEQLVRGTGFIVNGHGLLLNVADAEESAELLKMLAKRFPSLGKNRLLLRKENDGMYLYATPWTRNGHPNHSANARLERLVLLRPSEKDETSPLSRAEIAAHFGPLSSERPLNLHAEVKTSPLELLPAQVISFSSKEYLVSQLQQLASD